MLEIHFIFQGRNRNNEREENCRTRVALFNSGATDLFFVLFFFSLVTESGAALCHNQRILL